jgi:hypothetical protein
MTTLNIGHTKPVRLSIADILESACRLQCGQQPEYIMSSSKYFRKKILVEKKNQVGINYYQLIHPYLGREFHSSGKNHPDLKRSMQGAPSSVTELVSPLTMSYTKYLGV